MVFAQLGGKSSLRLAGTGYFSGVSYHAVPLPLLYLRLPLAAHMICRTRHLHQSRERTLERKLLVFACKNPLNLQSTGRDKVSSGTRVSSRSLASEWRYETTFGRYFSRLTDSANITSVLSVPRSMSIWKRSSSCMSDKHTTLQRDSYRASTRLINLLAWFFPEGRRMMGMSVMTMVRNVEERMR